MQNFPQTQDKTKKLDSQEKSRLSPLGEHSLDLTFSAPDISSDGGLLLIRELDEHLGLTEQIAACITDSRHQSYIQHDLKLLLRQRVYQIIAGYEDANDSNELRTDSILKMCMGELPQSGADLASQPTISRLENMVSRTDLYRIAKALAEIFIKSYESAPQIIIIDSDDTNSNAHGKQQQIEYNHYYGEYCHMPLHIYEGLSGKLITTLLKPGRRSKAVDVFAIVRRIVIFIRSYWPDTIIILRGDSHFCSLQLMDWCKDKKGIGFITGLTSNARLKKEIEWTKKSAEKLYEQNQYDEVQLPVKCYHSFEYKAQSWQELQRVVAKVEVNEKGTNIRYVVTNLRQYKTKGVYEELYAGRGEMELFIKDHKTYLKSDKLSCTKFEANQFRLFFHSIAYILLHFTQELFPQTVFANATKKTLQLKLIKVAAIVKEGKNRIKIEFPHSNPRKGFYQRGFKIFEIIRTQFSGP